MPCFYGWWTQNIPPIFYIVAGFICKKNLKPDTNELRRLIDDKQFLLYSNLVMESTGDVALETVTGSNAEDKDYSEEEGSDEEMMTILILARL